MKKKIFFIVVSVLAMLSVTIYMGVRLQRTSQKTFTKAGYILNAEKQSGNDSDSKSVKYYFDVNTEYKNNYDNSIEFKDTNGDKVKVDEASFVHYNDNSISLLKKGVILNLEEVTSAVPKYYNLFEGTVLEFVDFVYYVDNLGKQIKFKSFIVRINDNKYLLVSDNMKLRIDNKDIEIKSNYVELSFIEEGIIKIENQEASYQTISKDASILIGDNLNLNLDNEYFFYNNEAKLNLKQIIIDSDDNIDIKPLEEKEETDENSSEDDKAASEGGAAGGLDVNTDNGSDNVGFEEEVVETEATLPTATITDMNITSNKLEANIRLADKDNIINGPSITTITENATGKIVYTKENAEGVYSIDLSVENLNPETTYNLTTRINYKKNDIEYTMDIVQQLFSTESLGISIMKDYFTYNDLAFFIKVDDYSKVKTATVSLLNSDGDVLENIEIDGEIAKEGNGQSVVFSSLSPNTKYGIRVGNILYDNYIVADSYSFEIGAKTLKVRPTVGDVNFSINKKNNSFELKINNIEDPNSGFEVYRYEIYDARTIADGTGPVATFERNNSSSIQVNVDDNKILRNVPYVFRVVGEFYDNEKYIEYISGFSETMRMDGVSAPSISWTAEEVTFERIKGVITIKDDNNTIDIDKDMSIVYTNSIGITKSITTAGNTVIPFDVNDLRANETYVISLYASVNLQDGNEEIDLYHVGSVTVKTKETNAFKAELVADTEIVEKAFSVQARLLNVDDADNELEAKTLTGITFTLYEGSTTDGRVVKTIKKVDNDLDAYISELKSMYYDNTFVLDPEFFGLKNADFTADYYTLKISNAYDYTTFSNDIPIIDGVCTMKINGFVPDLPSDVDNAVDYSFIRNKDAGDHYDSNLDATTIVGVKVRAAYDNAKKFAKELHYNVKDATTGTTILTHTYKVPDDGSINWVTFWFENGTTYDTVDTVLTRGHNYVFTYDALLDLNYDNEAETTYPMRPEVVLSSQVAKVPKQAPVITMYPSTSTGDTFTIKYTYYDVDHALYQEKLHAGIGVTTESSTNVDSVTLVENGDISASGKITFTNLVPGYLKIYGDIALFKNPDSITQEKYIYQYFEGAYLLNELKYNVEVTTNKVIISVDNPIMNAEAINRVAALKIVFTCGDKSVTKDFVKLIDGKAVVDVFSISEFKNKNVTVSVYAYYDSGVVGFDTDCNYYALKNIKDEFNILDEYYTIDSTGKLEGSISALGSIYSKKKDSANNKIILTNKNTNQTFEINDSPGTGGYLYNYQYMILKELKEAELKPVSSNVFTFNQVIPGISLLDQDGNSQIAPTTRTVNILANIYGYGTGEFSASKIKDDLIYIDIQAVTDLGHIDESVPEQYRQFVVTKTISELENTVEIGNLLPKQNYAMTFWAYISTTENPTSDDDYTYKQLYDIDENLDSKVYNFKTLHKIDIKVPTKTSYELVTNKYDDKYIKFSYELDAVVGYDRIQYQIYENVLNSETGVYEWKLMDINIPEETIFSQNMVLKIPCNPGSNFVFGQSYKIVITAFVDVQLGDEIVSIDLDAPGTYTGTLPALRSPFVGFNSSIVSNGTNSLTFTVSMFDVDNVIPNIDPKTGEKVDGYYTISVVDSEGKDVSENSNIIVPSDYKGMQKSLYKKFVFTGVNTNESYLLILKYYADLNNTGKVEDMLSFTKTYQSRSLGSSGVDIGDVTASANSEAKNAIDLTFRNSYKLDSITKLRYSVYNAEDGTGFDGLTGFSPEQIQLGNETVYRTTLPDFLVNSGVYYVQLQFLNSSNAILAETTLDYSYVG